MRTPRAIPGVLVAALLLATPTWAQPDARIHASSGLGLCVQAAEAPVMLSAQEATNPKKPRKKASDEDDTKKGFVWADHPSLRLGKLFQMDFRLKVQADVRQSPLDLASRGGAFEWRRLRGGIKGSFLKYFEYEVERDLDQEGSWRDVYLNFRYAGYAQIQGGKFKVPFGNEQLTGATALDFAERTRVSDALAPGRDIGVMVHGRVFKRVIRYQGGVFNHDGDNSPTLEPAPLLPGEQPLAEKRSWAGRVTFAPLRLGSLPARFNNLEIGGAVASGTVPEGMNNLRGEMVLGDKFFHREYYTRGRRLRLGVEMSWAPGPFSVTSEYIQSSEARERLGVGNEQGLDNDLPDIEGRGWYVAGSWVATGEKKDGGVKPRRPFLQGGLGAIEVVVRYESLRFASAGAPQEPASDSPRAANIRGNGERALTGGLNWYVNRWVKVQVNGIREQLDDPERGPVPGRSSFWTLVSRVQFVL